MQDPFKIPLKKLEQAIERAKPRLVHALGVEALKFADDNFAKQGFMGTVFTAWPGRKKKEKGALRKILVKTGTLRRSLRQEDSLNHTTITTDIPYAQTHNEGLSINIPGREQILNFDKTPKNGKWRFGKVQTENQQRKIKQIRRATISGYTVKMPKRQFIGTSPILSARCRKELKRILKEEIKKTH